MKGETPCAFGLWSSWLPSCSFQLALTEKQFAMSSSRTVTRAVLYGIMIFLASANLAMSAFNGVATKSFPTTSEANFAVCGVSALVLIWTCVLLGYNNTAPFDRRIFSTVKAHLYAMVCHMVIWLALGVLQTSTLPCANDWQFTNDAHFEGPACGVSWASVGVTWMLFLLSSLNAYLIHMWSREVGIQGNITKLSTASFSAA